MRRLLSILSAVALTGTLLIVAPTVASAATTQVIFKSKPVAVNETGYKMTIEVQGTNLTITLRKRDAAAGSLQEHRYTFTVPESTVSNDLGSGHVEGDFGNFGSMMMDFSSTRPVSRKDTCGGEITTKKRTGTLAGTFEFMPDTQGNAFFETISFENLKTTVKRTRYKNCQDGGKLGTCPQQVSLFANEAGAIKYESGDVTVSVSVREDTAPATYINHFVQGRTSDSSKMTYEDDLSAAEVDSSGITSLISGMLSFTASDPPSFAQDGKCKGGKWESDFAPGSVTGMFEAHYDSFGDVTVTPTSGGLQRWVKL